MSHLSIRSVVGFVLASLLLVVASLSSFTIGRGNTAFGRERVDSVTQRNGMHSCPPGEFVTGVHLERNLLLCSDDFGAYIPDTETVDGGTQQKGWHPEEGTPSMRACPSGSAVTGLHWNRNLLACARFPSRMRAVFVDKQQQRQGMHACPPGTVLVGHQSAKNWLLCGTSEHLTGSLDRRNGMRSCPLGAFMTGVHLSKDVLLCSFSFGGYSEAEERVNQSTVVRGRDRAGQEFGARGCPEGMAMTGIDESRNLRTCAPISSASTRFVDADRTQRANMIACPLQSVAVAYNAFVNLLVCAR